jgi:hypothetical protein
VGNPELGELHVTKAVPMFVRNGGERGTTRGVHASNWAALTTVRKALPPQSLLVSEILQSNCERQVVLRLESSLAGRFGTLRLDF